MALRIHNSMNRRTGEFRPLVPGRIGMYVCGITVYDYCHIGHARLLVAFDVVARWLVDCRMQLLDVYGDGR